MIATGLDVLVRNLELLRNRSVGLLVNQTSLTASMEYSWQLLQKQGITIRRIFSPEHGLFATEQDQIAVSYQPELGCEVVSLYGDSAATLVPDAALLDDIEVVIFDIQDVGARYYTYVNTLALFMEAIAGRDIELMVLDRPNPLGGEIVEGALLDMAFSSFVGVFPVPVRHALTAGELALLYRDVKQLDVELQIVKMEGWKRSMLYDETGLPWIPPSPNMPTVATAEVYPGMCLFEGLNVSEGRGTTTPFQLSGAPFINPIELAERCHSYGLEGVRFRPIWFKPTFHKFAGEVIGGIWQQVTDKQRYRSFATAIAMTAALRELYGEQVSFLRGVYEFNDTIPAFDLLAGNATIRTAIEQGNDVHSIISLWQQDEAQFAETKLRYHLY